MFDIKSYNEAETIEQALELLKTNPNAQIIAGGTDVLIKAREHKTGFTQRDLVGVTRIPKLQEISIDEKTGDIFIGGACSFTKVENNEIILKNIKLLSNAVGTVGGPQVRNTGTIGGNVCNGATSADSASTLFALNAKCIIANEGVREVQIKDFYLGPGKVDLKQGDLLLGFKIEKKDYEGFCGEYIKFSPRNAMDIATLCCSVWAKQQNGEIKDLRIAFGVAGPTPIRATQAEEFAINKKINNDLVEEIGELCLQSARARDSWRASKAFREQLIRELPKRALKIALELEANNV